MCQALIGQEVVVCYECIITSYARMNQVAGACEYGNELSGSIKCGGIS